MAVVDRDGAIDGDARWDFFVSYTQADRSWAEWISWKLEEDGYRVLVQAWDLVPGTNWVFGMQEGVTRSERTLAVLSTAYTKSVYGSAEWQAAWRADPTGARRKLLVARVEDCDRPGMLGQVVSFDLFGLAQDDARDELLKAAKLAVTGARAKPSTEPPFPPAATTTSPAPAPPGTGLRPEPAPRSAASHPAGPIQIGTVSAPGGTAIGVNHGRVIQRSDGERPSPRNDGQAG
ncbi:TIR protein [Frankia sp. CcI49]|uniref:toll/interleukin-1 receptor domain-containing protein n=1 Tax=unclassified Frankia TaxID=2632575 RepID=UPI0006DAD8D7|nr:MULTISPECIES: toll/interleukin-1 receptor domain-containing protein [unclassified Frankia]KPM52543.1 TIR protein [Frankia sp. R43]ONH59737.1 TIR protein [Frankia sp. CcI49]